MRLIPFVGFNGEDFDLEGVAVLGNRLWVVDEDSGAVIEFELDEGLSEAKFVSMTPVMQNFGGGSVEQNNGLEGIAVRAPDGNVSLSLAKERSPRALADVRPDLDHDVHWTVIPTPGYPRVVAWRGVEFQVSEDFAGLDWDGGSLYALSRNTWTVSKFDSATLEILGRVQLPRLESENFEREEPYGFADGLLMEDDVIVVVYDSGDAARLKPVGSNATGAALFARFARPEGF